LVAGIYELRVDAPYFKRAVVTDVRVRSSNIVELNVTLEVGAVAETVNITAAAVQVQTESSSMVSSSRNFSAEYGNKSALVNEIAKSSRAMQQAATPRLREYFPETLVWKPDLETDKQGRAQLRFKLADNITTWKMSVIGSTEDGQIGTIEKEIKAFQPFFIEHDPPKVLTEGDEISLPVVVRNYLERTQTVDLMLKPESWFTLLVQRTRVLRLPRETRCARRLLCAPLLQ